MRLNIFIEILIVFVLIFVTPNKSAQIRFTGTECQSKDPTFLSFDICILKPVSRDVKELTFIMKLLQGPVTNVTIRADLTRRGYNKHPLYSFDIDACRFMQSKHRNPVANAIYTFFRLEIYSNMNHSCPFDHDIILDHFRIDNTLKLQLPIPMGEYKIKSYWLAYNVLRATVNMNIVISE